jgi:hypothetical protein
MHNFFIKLKNLCFYFWNEFTTLKGKNINKYIKRNVKHEFLIFWFWKIQNSNINYKILH